MKYFTWNDEKNEKLKAERNVSFEEVVFYIERGYLLDILEHSNKKKYHGQRIFVVQIENYVYLVPFVEGEDQIFLKTIIPSRKATMLYLKGGDENAKVE
jgi:uncharacterized DUF497 family protein